MRRFPALISLLTLSAAAAIGLLAGCTSGSTIAPKPAVLESGAQLPMDRVAGVFKPSGLAGISIRPARHFTAFDACPATRTIEYVSDYNNGVIDIFAGKFAGQKPCGMLTSGLSGPSGLYVQPATHDVYVANFLGFDVLVFHRGQTTPYNTYTDPTGHPPRFGINPLGVTVARDGTVIASNKSTSYSGSGSLSTWIEGANGGTFVGNFPMTNDNYGGFVTVRRNGLVYYNDIEGGSGFGAIWSLSCPAGQCGAQTQVNISCCFDIGGMAIDETGDLLFSNGNGFAETFELPNPSPQSFTMRGTTYGMAINERNNHWFAADYQFNDAEEYAYPSGTLVGTVKGNSRGAPLGIAVDP